MTHTTPSLEVQLETSRELHIEDVRESKKSIKILRRALKRALLDLHPVIHRSACNVAKKAGGNRWILDPQTTPNQVYSAEEREIMLAQMDSGFSPFFIGRSDA